MLNSILTHPVIEKGFNITLRVFCPELSARVNCH